ncbi:hypothetical protein SOVF_164240, partial [Spinacia oleracea]|jgi:hypothetical protein
MESK